MGHDPHYFAIYDDKQRMVALLCHNNHYGDGWEHEGDDESYFRRYSSPWATRCCSTWSCLHHDALINPPRALYRWGGIKPSGSKGGTFRQSRRLGIA